jgi:hypothetical protein
MAIMVGLTGVSSLSGVTGVTLASTLSVMVGRSRPEVIFCSNSSRTESFIIQPQEGQIESVGAKSLAHLGQFIGLGRCGWRKLLRERYKNS